jgi:hypothetical protein
MSPWRRAGTVLAIVTALGGFTWLETVVPGYASLGIAILAAIAWCRWLEQHAAAPPVGTVHRGRT